VGNEDHIGEEVEETPAAEANDAKFGEKGHRVGKAIHERNEKT